MFEIIALIVATILQTNLNSTDGPITPTQLVPFISNSQVIIIGQVILGLLIIAAITLQLRNMRIGKLLIKDKTIMFAGFINKEDYERVIASKGHLFRMIPEEEVIKHIEEEETTVSKATVIEPNDIDGSLKREED